MHKVERYGVIALVFLVVTVVVVTLWDDQGAAEAEDEPQVATVRSAPTTPAATRPAPRPLGTEAVRTPERPALSQPGRATAPAVHRPDGAERQPAGPGGPGSTAPRGPSNGPSRVATVADTSVHAPGGPASVAANRLEVGRTETGPTAPAPRAPEASPPAARTAARRGDARSERVPTSIAPRRSTAMPTSTPTTYTVRAGDSLSVISQRTLGTSKRWKEIQTLNGIPDPTRIEVGQVLKLPAGATASLTPTPEASRPSTSPRRPAPVAGRTYTIRSGDSLSVVAQRELGEAARWTEIVSLNAGLDPLRLSVGTRITLPAGGTGTSVEAPDDKVVTATPRRTSRRDPEKPRVR